MREHVVKMKLLFYLLAVTFFSLVNGASGVETDRVSVLLMEGDSVTLHTGVTTTQQEEIKWFLSHTRIAQISGDLSFICTDVQCNEGTEKFRDRLKLDNQTGSLTIMDITTTDSGDYELQIISSTDSTKIFSVNVHSVPADEQVKKNEGESVTLDPDEIKSPNVLMMWYFNDTPIDVITGDQSKFNKDYERFRDRLKLDNQTGSLTIMNTRTTDTGLYKLEINISDSSFSINRVKRCNVMITSVPDSGLSTGEIVGIVVGVVGGVILLVVVAVKYCRRRNYSQAAQNDNVVNNPPPNPGGIPLRRRVHN